MCSTKLHSLVSSLEYLVSNGRQVFLGGIRLGGSATWALVVWSLFCCCVVSYVARHLVDALRYPGVITPTVAPEHFCDHEVIVKAL